MSDLISREEAIRVLEPQDRSEITKSVILLDLFTKTFCRYPNDYERFNDLMFRCKDCPFEGEGHICSVKLFKNMYAPDYKDFGAMWDLPEGEKEPPVFIDSAPLKDCKNTAESYGEICVKCNKCGRFGKGNE